MMPTSEHKLLPCPFCGSEAIHRTTVERYPTNEDGPAGIYDIGHEIGCFAECGFSISDEYFEDVANTWNRRALSAAEGVKPRVKPLTYDEVEKVIKATECAELSDRGDQIWTRRQAVALTDLFNARLSALQEGE